MDCSCLMKKRPVVTARFMNTGHISDSAQPPD